MTSSSDIPLKRSTFLLTFLKVSSIFSCPSAGGASLSSFAFLGLGPGLALGALGALGSFGSFGSLFAGLPRLPLAGAMERGNTSI